MVQAVKEEHGENKKIGYPKMDTLFNLLGLNERLEREFHGTIPGTSPTY